jgi:hypothetical protein
MVQPICIAQSPLTINLLNSMAKGEGVFGLGLTPSLRFQGNILSPQERYNYGAGRVTN